MYSPELLDHFEHPRNSGQLAGATARHRIENPACGDVLELAIKIVDERVEDLRFLAKGCVPAMACASAVTELAKGKSVAEARAVQQGRCRACGRQLTVSLGARGAAGDRCACRWFWAPEGDNVVICRMRARLGQRETEKLTTPLAGSASYVWNRVLHLRFSGKAGYHRSVLQSPHFPCRRSSRQIFRAPDGRNWIDFS